MEIFMLYIYLECLWMLAYVSFFLVYTITSITSFYTWIWFSCCPCFGYLVEKWVPGFQEKNSVPRSCSFSTFGLSLFSYVNFCLVMISSWLDIVHWTFDAFGYCMWFLCMIVVLKKKNLILRIKRPLNNVEEKFSHHMEFISLAICTTSTNYEFWKNLF